MTNHSKIKILHVIGNLGLGGAQSLLYHLWPSLVSSERFDFEICTIDYIGHFGEQLSIEGAIIHCLQSHGKLFSLSAVRKLRKIVIQGNYSIIHAHLFPEIYLTLLATAGLRNIDLVYTEHQAYNRRRDYPFFFKFLEQFVYHQYSHVIAVNESTRKNLQAWVPGIKNRSIVIPNAVRTSFSASNRQHANNLHPDHLVKQEDSVKRILFAGRLTQQKGADVLLKAFSELLKMVESVQLLIAGEGPDRAKLQSMVTELRISEKVTFLGTRSDIIDLLSHVDLMVLPSRWEGLSIVLLEAMAVGCPIVATAVDGTAEILEDGYSALLVSPDQPQALAKAISQVLQNRQLQQALANRAQKIVNEHHSADLASRRLFEVYQNVLLQRGNML